MLAERYLKRRFEEGKSEGIELGKEAGKAAGIELGRAAERARSRKYAARLRAWAESRIEATEKGEPFDEPMPELDDEDDAA